MTGPSAPPEQTSPAALLPRVLLHVCCAPCATQCVEVLTGRSTEGERVTSLAGRCDVTLFFSNSNISPEAEYRRRVSAARELAGRLSLPLVEDPYDHDAWLTAVAGHETDPEGGARCGLCFAFSLGRAAAYAAEHGFDWFATTLTVSRFKNSKRILEIGSALGPMLPADFKKRGGFEHSVRLARELGLYRQDYCGCEFGRRT